MFKKSLRLARRSCVHAGLAVAICAATSSCNSTHRDVHLTGRPIGDLQSLNDYVADVQISSKPILGTAEGGTALLVFKTGAMDYSDCIVYDGGAFTSVSNILGSGRLAEIKRAAIRDACARADCDVLAYPMFEWTEQQVLFGSTYVVTVKGYPGHLREIRGVEREVVPGRIRLGPSDTDDQAVPEQNRYRVETQGGGAVNLNLQGAVPSGQSGGSSKAGMSTGRFGWRGEA